MTASPNRNIENSLMIDEHDEEVTQEQTEALLALARDEMGGYMTKEERLEYLRERGIQIDLPSTGANSRLVEEARAAWLRREQDCKDAKLFSYISLPAENSRPAEELMCRMGAGDVLPGFLASIFSGGNISDEALMQAAKEQNERVGVAALREAASHGATEVFRLTAASTGEAVNAYFDDCAALKMLPLNGRASKLAQLCGFDEGCTFQGDVYIGRLRYDGDLLYNVNIALGELEPGSHWLHRAPVENLRLQKMTQPEAHTMAEKVAQFNTFASGGGDGYAWEDAEEDFEILVFMDASERTAKLPVKVNFSRRYIEMIRPRPYKWMLYASIDPDGCSWTYCDKGISICVQKEVEGRWPQLCNDVS